MKALWSFRNCKGGDLSRLDVILPLFSVIMWGRCHPNHIKVLYVYSDYMTEFEKFNILQFWDEVKLLTSRDDINIKHFWSVSKVEALEQESGPLVHVDGDFIPYTSLHPLGIFEGDMGVTLLEEIKNAEHLAYIDSSEAAKFGDMDSDEFEWDDFADQTSLLYLNNDELKNQFIQKYYEYAEVVSNKKIDHHLAYILFIEQKYLRELANSMGVDKRYLIKDGHKVSNTGTLPDIADGTLPIKEAWKQFYHYGPNKGAFVSDLMMAYHMGTYILPIVDNDEVSKIFWHIYASKPFIEKKETLLNKVMKRLNLKNK